MISWYSLTRLGFRDPGSWTTFYGHCRTEGITYKAWLLARRPEPGFGYVNMHRTTDTHNCRQLSSPI